MARESLFSKSTVNYTLSTFFVKAMMIGASFIIARLLRPAEYGLWITLSLIIGYMANINFGLLNAMNREVPFYNGKKEFKEVDSILSTAFTSDLFLAGAVSLALLAVTYSPFFEKSLHQIVIPIRLLAPVVFLQQIYLYYQIYYRGYHRFDFLSKLEPFYAAASAVLMVSFVYLRRSLDSLLIALVLSYCLTLIYNYSQNKFIPKLRVDLARTLSLVWLGFPIMLSGLIGTFFFTAERLIIVTLLGSEQLGYYGISLMAVGLLQLFPAIVSVIAYPRFVQLYGASNKDIKKLKDPFVLMTSHLALFLAVSFGFIYFGIPPFVSKFLPAYSPGILPAQLISIGIFFYCITPFTGIFLVTINKQAMYVYFSLLGLILSAAVNLYFIRKGWGLIGVAMGTSLTYFLYSFVSLTYSLRHFVNKAFVLYSILGRIFSPFLYILCGIALLNKLFEIFLGPSYDQADLATALTKIGFFVIWVLPMAIFFVRNKKLISEFRELKKALGLYPI